MGNQIFGKPKEQPPVKTPPSLQEQILILEKRKTHLQKLIEINYEKAKKSTTKEEAMRYLKLKTNYETELKSIYGMLDRLEGLDNARQRIILQVETVRATEHATDIIKKNTIDSDKVVDIMFEAKDAIEEVDKVSEALGRMDAPNYELEEEVNAMFAERTAPPQQPEVPVILQFPEVPVTRNIVEDTSEKELKMLVPS